MNEVELQHSYYKDVAHRYNDMQHVDLADGEHEHNIALRMMSSFVELMNIRTILDVGTGTGRCLEYLLKRHPDIDCHGVEPVQALREEGIKNGIPSDRFIDADAGQIPLKNDSIDLVCEFGVLHHVRQPNLIVGEMLRVAKKGIFISDCNNFGMGGYLFRTFKQSINALGLWRVFNFVRTRGKGYMVSEGDGVFYSYSVFNNLKQIQKCSKQVHILNTKGNSCHPYREASHIALMAIKS